ncbi:hypothetical protein [Couchioplanes azureus]|uniref:hypothetical protein n=1 Tax=Couchioplanes caeruleus TaxID=56438 RepID=UPI001670FE9F|nr:hypothetical protein [Couchioplanes caeruleus]GGQ71540.1 hypothetical protein GCM10010166_47090 [Couchioplanes caeruleus subsp. azureus]
MASDAVTAITNDHRLMEQLFARLKAGDGDRRELLAEVEARLRAHARAEEGHGQADARKALRMQA